MPARKSASSTPRRAAPPPPGSAAARAIAWKAVGQPDPFAAVNYRCTCQGCSREIALGSEARLPVCGCGATMWTFREVSCPEATPDPVRGTARTRRPASQPTPLQVARQKLSDSAKAKKACEFAKTFGFHDWVAGGVSGKTTCETCGAEFAEGDNTGRDALDHNLSPRRKAPLAASGRTPNRRVRTCSGCGLSTSTCTCPDRASAEWPRTSREAAPRQAASNDPDVRARSIASRLTANTLKVLFVRSVAALKPAVWVELYEACSVASSDGASFDQWAKKFGLEIDDIEGAWLRALGWRIGHADIMPLSLWSPSPRCHGCETALHTIGNHWEDSFPRRRVRVPSEEERRAVAAIADGPASPWPPRTQAEVDAAAVVTDGVIVPHRRPRAAHIAVEAFVRHHLCGETWNRVVERLAKSGEHRSMESVKDLARRARLDLGLAATSLVEQPRDR